LAQKVFREEAAPRGAGLVVDLVAAHLRAILRTKMVAIAMKTHACMPIDIFHFSNSNTAYSFIGTSGSDEYPHGDNRQWAAA
jgi:hypothetical protein